MVRFMRSTSGEMGMINPTSNEFFHSLIDGKHFDSDVESVRWLFAKLAKKEDKYKQTGDKSWEILSAKTFHVSLIEIAHVCHIICFTQSSTIIAKVIYFRSQTRSFTAIKNCGLKTSCFFRISSWQLLAPTGALTVTVVS